MKRLDAIITTQKNSTLFNVALLKKNTKKIFNINYHFWWVLLIISATVPVKELRFFALLSVYPDASVELSNTPVQ